MISIEWNFELYDILLIQDKGDVKNESQSDSEKKLDESIKKDSKTEQNEEEEHEDKIWADVDKDLGDILAEAESGNKSSDEDEDSVANGERFDRYVLLTCSSLWPFI